MLDTLRQVETPEGVALNLHCAGMVPRALAWLLDFLIRGAGVVALTSALGLLGGAGAGVAMVLMFLVFWAYPIAFELLYDGQTPGKRTFGLKVVNDNGTPVTWLPSVVRNLMRTVDMMPALYGFGLASGLADPHGRRLGDHVAGTLVVYAGEARSRPPAPDAAPQRPPLALQLDEQRAIIAFAERAPQTTPERQAELADVLEPVTGAYGSRAVALLLGMANYLLGRR
jgi:uncharacterized RDD family membrane protein YckC